MFRNIHDYLQTLKGTSVYRFRVHRADFRSRKRLGQVGSGLEHRLGVEAVVTIQVG